MRNSISELLDFVDDVVDDLSSHREINYLRALLDLVQQVMEGIGLDAMGQFVAS